MEVEVRSAGRESALRYNRRLKERMMTPDEAKKRWSWKVMPPAFKADGFAELDAEFLGRPLTSDEKAYRWARAYNKFVREARSRIKLCFSDGRIICDVVVQVSPADFNFQNSDGGYVRRCKEQIND